MEVWIIVLMVLAAINLIAFFLVFKLVYDDRKRSGQWEWRELIIGLFFIPVCVLMTLVWLIKKFFRHHKKVQCATASKKYHLQHFSFRLSGTPFVPSSNEIILVENGYNERLNEMIKRNISFIQECFDKNKYVHPQFVYLPCLFEQLSHEENSIGYLTPYSNGVFTTANSLKSSFLLEYLLVPENRSKIIPCFARFQGEFTGGLLFECIGFETEEDIDEMDFFRTLCSAFDLYPLAPGPMYCTTKPPQDDKTDADKLFDKESKLLMKEVEERICQLRKMGISQWALEQLVKPKLKHSHLVITKEYEIVLPDYKNMVIKIEPLAKAVYLLFLRHPEGLMFKELPAYREELTEIYLQLKPNGLTDKVMKSIEDVTNPLMNSINEKCARIRGAFIQQFDEHLARYYYIDGRRAQPKKIALSRELVVWEK